MHPLYFLHDPVVRLQEEDNKSQDHHYQAVSRLSSHHTTHFLVTDESGPAALE